MHFEDNPLEAAFRAELRAWLEQHAEPRGDEDDLMIASIFAEDAAAGDDARLERARRWQRQAADAGWAAPSWPTEYGGRGCSLLELMVYGEELGRFRVPPVFHIGIGILGPTIIAHGTPEQKQRYLPPMLRGDEIWCQLWSEPDAGSDLASLRCRAELDEDTGEWVLNGQKVWSSGAHYSRFGLGVFRSDPHAPKHEGITCLIVEMSVPGIEIRPLRQMTGGAHFNEVFFNDARVPAENVVGQVNGGWAVARTTMINERMSVAGMTPPSEDFRPLLRLARKTSRQGRPASEDRVVRQRLAQVYTAGRVFELTTARVRSALAQGKLPGAEGSILKLVVADVTTANAELAVDILGSGGLLAGEDAPEHGRWVAALLGAPSLHIGGGTDEIQRNIIGERVLGLPREPGEDKSRPFREAEAQLSA